MNISASLIALRTAAAAICAGLLVLVLTRVSLAPEVDRQFFFAESDPQLQADQKIHAMFGGTDLVVVAVEGDLESPKYQRKLEKLSGKLAAVKGVYSVRSLTRGPSDYSDALDSPLWRRLLIAPDRNSSNLVVSVKQSNYSSFVPAIVSAAREFDSEGFRVRMSGVPYLVERVRKLLLDDVKTFTGLTVAVVALIAALLFRSVSLLLAMLLACGAAAALTLLSIHILDIQLGVLTANLLSVTCVLTVSHVVFLTFAASSVGGQKSNPSPIILSSVKRTFQPALWSALTSGFGFATFLFADAKPLREFGTTGALAALWSFCSAFTVYAIFLGPSAGRLRTISAAKIAALLNWRGLPAIVLAIVAAAGFLSAGLNRLNTDPSLLSYFDSSSELHEGLKFIDITGGSTPLQLVVYDRAGDKFSKSEVYERAWDLQHDFEDLREVGSVLSLPLIMAEANRSPLSKLLTWNFLLDLIEDSEHAGAVAHFLSGDRKFAHFILRMREEGRSRERADVISEIKRLVEKHGFGLLHIGGIYSLQKQMGKMLRSSILQSLVLMLPAVLCCSLLLTRSVWTSFAITIAACISPLLVLGTCAAFEIPLDLASSASATLVCALGVDQMFHLAREKQLSGASWRRASIRLATPVLTSAAVIAGGFSVLLASNFPPSARFGAFVFSGILLAALAALLALPLLASPRSFLRGKGQDD